MKPRHEREPTTYPSTPRKHATLDLTLPHLPEELPSEHKKRVHYQISRSRATFFDVEMIKELKEENEKKPKKKSKCGCF